MKDHFDQEEDFHSKDRKQFRKARKILQAFDRSKFKKTDTKEKLSNVDETLPRGRVVSITGEGIWVDHDDKRHLCTLKGILKKEKMLSKNLVAVGDYVRFSGDTVIQVEPRFSTLARTDISGLKEQLIATNIDQVLIIVSVLEPPLKTALIDRYLIAAAKGNLHPVIIVNKIDLLSTSLKETVRYREFLAAYEPLGFPILSLSTKTGAGIDAFRSLMKDKTSVISGQSGVGKSSLLNVAFNFERKIGDVAGKTFKGTHTTSVAELIPLPGGGYCIDTPGIRSFGVWKLTRAEVCTHFTEIAELARECYYPDCKHTAEPRCAVLKALEEGRLSLIRYESYVTLLDEALGGADNRAKRKLEM